MLKRGLSSTIKELLMSAEYIVAHGNPDVILCERGIRTFETATRNTCDIAAIAVLDELSHLPVVLDPSHATGKRSLGAALARAGVAMGADGIYCGSSSASGKGNERWRAIVDSEQFDQMMRELEPYIQLWKASRVAELARPNPPVKTALGFLALAAVVSRFSPIIRSRLLPAPFCADEQRLVAIAAAGRPDYFHGL